jgi:hypothetical protein
MTEPHKPEEIERDEVIVRNLRPEDREQIRAICCNTGFLGKPIDPVFEDRELFADFLTAYYTDDEPESAFVLDRSGRVEGYVLGSRFPKRQKDSERRAMPGRLAKVFWRFCFRYGKASRRYVLWLLTRGWREVPMTPPDMPHFHINLLPGSKNVGKTRELIDYFLNYLREAGETSVYGQVVAFEEKRGARMFARYGFKVVDTMEVTKYRSFVDHPVFLFTVIKDLAANTGLYGKDLWKEGDDGK